MASITVIDDRSPSITYSPGWRPVTPAETSLHTVLNGTETATNTEVGAEISVFGSINSTEADTEENIPAPISAYSIDSGAPTIFTATTSQNTTKDRVTFFRATGLDLDVSHTLVITTKNQGSFILDWIQLNSTRDFTAGEPTISHHSGPSITAGDLGGIVVGSLAFLCLIAAAVIYLSSLGASQTELDMVQIMGSNGQDHTVNPFIIGQMILLCHRRIETIFLQKSESDFSDVLSGYDH
ncbi:hypothetical protein D9613_008871 [Agrocybe pediades]|uniref:Uncharacterized protein n=1 Tax=Agrocybe pediades TaxID=84607 RepID=A0A8H4QU68_9AGAR|nr:hypothetical protein D9613_008871 [Agrocybe pediades]